MARSSSASGLSASALSLSAMALEVTTSADVADVSRSPSSPVGSPAVTSYADVSHVSSQLRRSP
eukprot:425698-Hanusia_phi.AAC.1